MAHSLEQWQAVRLSKPMTVNVSVFPEANIVAKEGEKIAVKIPEHSVVYVAIMGPKAGQSLVPIVPQQQQQQPQQVAHQPAAKTQQQGGHPAQKGQKKPAATYKPKAQQPSNGAQAATNNASAANGTVTAGDAAQGQQQGGKQQNRAGKGNNNPRNRNNNKNKAAANEPKVITAEDLKRQREEQAKHEAWLLQRKEFERKEREEQDRRYKERLERQKKAKEEADARRKAELAAKGVVDEEQPEQEKEGEKESSGPKSCWICGSDKHIARKCSNRCRRSGCNAAHGPHSSQNCKEVCLLCKGKGHDEWYCDKRCPVCRRGNGEAHLLQDCPVECRLCGAKGHRDRDCEYSYGNRNRAAAAN